MGKKCPNPDCGWDGNAPEWEFCGHCGTDLSTAPQRTEVTKVMPRAEVYPEPEPAKAKPAPAVSWAKAKLVVMQAGQTGREFTISGDSAAIGRWDADAGAFPEVDLTEDDPNCYVSRHHARIFVRDGRYFIEDLGSANKTVINKAIKLNPHSPHELKNGDEIIVGKTFLKFVIEY